MYKNKINAKLVFYAPQAYALRGWVSVIAAVILFSAYAFGFASTTIFLMSSVALFWGGELFIRGTIRELQKLYIGFNCFVTLSAVSAFLFSIVNNFGGVAVVNVSGAALMLPFILAMANFIKVAELRHINSSYSFMEGLDNFIPKAALRVEGTTAKKVFAEEVAIGDIILVKTGERVPLDCEITKGSTIIDEYLLTGNITFAAKQKGDKVLAGSINKGQEFYAKTISLRHSTQIAKVLEAVKESEKRKLSAPSVLEKYSFGITIFFMGFAVLQLIGGILFNGDINYWSCIALFILALSGPVSYMAAVLVPLRYMRKGAASAKITVNNPHAFEVLNAATKIFIDKTGTLTTGKLEVSEIVVAEGVKQDDLMKCACTAQQGSNSIFAQALAAYAKENKIKTEKAVSVEMHPSFGGVVRTAKDTIYTGRRNWLEGMGIKVENPQSELKKTVFYVSKNDKYMGCIFFSDRLRANAKGTISFLKEEGKEVCLISGDNAGALEAASTKAGIAEYYGDMYPQDKAAKIAAQSNLGGTIAMIGDGFNDILALLQADVSIAFATSQNTFTSWVDIAVSGKDFGAVKKIFDFDKRQQAVIRQNIFISILFSVFAVWAVVIYKYSMAWYELIALVFVSIIFIIINSVRLKHD